MADMLTSELARHVSQRRYEEVPPADREAARSLFLDTLAVGWGGTASEGLPPLRDGLLGHGSGRCDVWGSRQRAHVLDATFLNGAAAAALEFDSLHDEGLIHSDLVCVPALFALAQHTGASGREFLVALVLANDVACRLALAARTHTGWWHTSLYGIFGAAAGCARLLGLDAVGVAHTFGIALGHAGGTQQPIVEKSVLKRYQSAIAARSAVFAAQLASWGVAAPAEPLRGKYGLYALFEEGGGDEALRDLGVRYEGSASSFKKFPTCGCGHAAIEAALQLAVEHALDPAVVECVTVRVSAYMNGLVGQPYDPGSTPVVAAQFSVRYGVACAIVRKRLGLAEIDIASATDPQLRAFAARVQVEIDERNSGKLAPAEVCVLLRDGRAWTRRVEQVPGTPRNPIALTDLRQKARECLRRGSLPLSEVEIDALLSAVATLEDLRDVGDLLR